MILIVFILGISIGSFLNVLIDRIPREESVMKGRSYCESCKHILAWYDLIPLFSYISLRGKCRYCHVRLSLYYPILEFVTGILFVMTFLFLPNSNAYLLAYFLFIISSLIVIFFTDLRYGIIPFSIVFPTIAVIFLYLILNNHWMLSNHIFSALGAALFFFCLFAFTKGRGMGFGDVVYVFLMGLLLGFPDIIYALYIAFVVGAIVSVILLLFKKKKLHGSTIPFGPFLVLGTVILLFWGQWIDIVVGHYFRLQ